MSYTEYVVLLDFCSIFFCFSLIFLFILHPFSFPQRIFFGVFPSRFYWVHRMRMDPKHGLCSSTGLQSVNGLCATEISYSGDNVCHYSDVLPFLGGTERQYFWAHKWYILVHRSFGSSLLCRSKLRNKCNHEERAKRAQAARPLPAHGAIHATVLTSSLAFVVHFRWWSHSSLPSYPFTVADPVQQDRGAYGSVSFTNRGRTHTAPSQDVEIPSFLGRGGKYTEGHAHRSNSSPSNALTAMR